MCLVPGTQWVGGSTVWVGRRGQGLGEGVGALTSFVVALGVGLGAWVRRTLLRIKSFVARGGVGLQALFRKSNPKWGCLVLRG